MSFPKTFIYGSLFTLLCIAGCSNSEDATSSDSSSEESQTTAPTVDTPKMSRNEGGPEAMANEGEYGNEGEGNYGDDMGPPAGTRRPGGNRQPQNATRQAIPRPANPLDWESDHITAAVEERDLKVIQALTTYADQHQGEDHSAQEVVGWLQKLNQPAVTVIKPNPASSSPGGLGTAGVEDGGPNSSPDEFALDCDPAEGDGEQVDGFDPTMIEEPGVYDDAMAEDMPGGQGKQGSAGADEQIAAALIDTLLSLHSLTSYQAARDLLEGNMELPFAPEKTAGWTMTSLIKHIDGPHDPAAKILKQSIEQPDLVRSGSGDFDASRLKDLALQEHWTSALAVMDGLMGLQSSSLSQSRKRNRNNYGGEYGGEGYAGEGEFNDPTMSEAGDVNPGGAPSATIGAQNNQKDEDPNAVNPIPDNLTLPDFTQQQAQAARNYLWSPELVNEVAQRLSESETLMKDPPLLLLAGQLPVTSTRYSFQQFLEKNWLMKDDWTRNPSSFVRHEIFSKYLRDPGLVVTLKHLPREQQTNQNNAGGGGEYGGNEGAGLQPNNNRQQKQDPEKLREQQIKHLWFETSQKVTLALMDRMLEAAQGNHLPKSNLDEVGIKLHRNAIVTVDSRLELALGEPSAEPEQDTRDKTTVNYIRIESAETDQREAQRETSHYKTALRKEQDFMILNNNGMWLSAPVEKDRKTGELVSTDVLLSIKNARPTVGGNKPQERSNDIANLAPNPEYGGGAGNTQTFVIEILVVRVPDPEIFLQPAEQAVSEK